MNRGKSYFMRSVEFDTTFIALIGSQADGTIEKFAREPQMAEHTHSIMTKKRPRTEQRYAHAIRPVCLRITMPFAGKFGG